MPAHRKINRIDLGTPDKLCVAALALARRNEQLQVEPAAYRGCVVELGSAFTACAVIDGGRVVDGLGGSCGSFGWASGGGWDGEAAYLLSPLEKRDLFAGGASAVPDPAARRDRFRESLVQAVAGLQAVTPFPEVVLSGRLLECEPLLVDEITTALGRLARVVRLDALPGAWVKHAAQGAALVADGLAGGRWAHLVDHLGFQKAAGTVLDYLSYPRAAEVRRGFGL